jgi:glycosyltransferase involved in cell wall biosynthesis
VSAAAPRVLVVHNRYRVRGGEERAVELQVEALGRAGVECRALERDSGRVSKARAAAAMLAGGEDPGEVARAVRELGATVVHVHNMHPLFGPRALEAAKEEGARVVLHLHNFRLFCSIAVAFRDGATCHRCRGRLTVPGIALNCRGSLPESAVYGAALSLHQPRVFEAVDRFVVPSGYGRGQLALLGAPAESMEVLANYLPESAFAGRSSAAAGEHVLFAGRLSPEKGADTAIAACAIADIPLKVAGDGPLADGLRDQATRDGAPVEFLGRVGGDRLDELRAGAALVIVPSRWGEILPFAALEAMAAGLPVVASRKGSLPEIVGEERCVPAGDADALAATMRALWNDPERRAREGDALLASARERFGEERYVSGLLGLYGRL